MSDAQVQSVPSLLEWPAEWYARHAAAPWRIAVSDELCLPGEESRSVGDIREGQHLIVRAYQDSAENDVVSVCILCEDSITREQTFRLQTAISIIDQMQHMGPTRSLCFMIHVWLMFRDWKHDPEGRASAWDDPLFREYLPDWPLYNLDTLLDFWNGAGSRWSAGFKLPDADGARISDYSTVPPQDVATWSQPIVLAANTPLLLDYELAPDGCVFCQTGAVFKARYDGCIVDLPNHIGMRYIHALLSRPSQILTISELIREVGQSEAVVAPGSADVPLPPDQSVSKRVTEQYADDDLWESDSMNEDLETHEEKRTDLQTDDLFRDEVARLMIERDRATTLPAKRDLETRIATYKSYVRFGDLPPEPKETKNARDKVKIAVERALKEQIKVMHPALFEHLDPAIIRNGNAMCYDPKISDPESPAPTWIT
jgi:hypothetical protein